MPLVLIARDPSKFSDEDLSVIVRELPKAIAEHLSVPKREEATLTPDDIEIRCSVFGPHDIHTRPLEILIFANNFPERQDNLEEKTKKIAMDLHGATIGGLNHFWIWILLGQGGFFCTPH